MLFSKNKQGRYHKKSGSEFWKKAQKAETMLDEDEDMEAKRAKNMSIYDIEDDEVLVHNI